MRHARKRCRRYALKINRGCGGCGSSTIKAKAAPLSPDYAPRTPLGSRMQYRSTPILQHDPSRIGEFVAAAERHPAAVINGVPQYDASVPAVRLHGRRITTVLVWLNTLSLQIADAMCGFRVYPIAPAVALDDQVRIGRRMEFDTEIIVRLFWAGTPVINLPTPVTYPADGVSHFRMLRDNLRITGLHFRLFAGMLIRLPRLLPRRLAGKAP